MARDTPQERARGERRGWGGGRIWIGSGDTQNRLMPLVSAHRDPAGRAAPSSADLSLAAHRRSSSAGAPTTSIARSIVRMPA